MLSAAVAGRGFVQRNTLGGYSRVITLSHAGECGGDLSVVKLSRVFVAAFCRVVHHCSVCVLSESYQAVCADGRHADDGNRPQGR